MEDCLFCKFANNTLQTTKLYEDDDMFIIRDIAPQAKNHFLCISKKHFKFITPEYSAIVGKMLGKISELKELLELENGYRIVINQGDDPGQTVPHLHIHILSGQKMQWNPA